MEYGIHNDYSIVAYCFVWKRWGSLLETIFQNNNAKLSLNSFFIQYDEILNNIEMSLLMNLGLLL